jgi:CRISPR system Cascade subunit CasE
MMYLSRLDLDLRSPGNRRDLRNPYEMHATLQRAAPGQGRILWRQEGTKGVMAQLYVQHSEPLDAAILRDRSQDRTVIHAPLTIEENLVVEGSIHRFRLVANPTVSRDKKRKAVVGMEEQSAWIHRKGGLHGFEVLGVVVTGEVMLGAKPLNSGRELIRYLQVAYDGHLRITDREALLSALHSGIGHAKAFGCGLLTLDRIYRRP